MNNKYQECLKVNDDRVQSEHEQRLEELKATKARLAYRREEEAAALEEAVRREERSAEVRRKVRELCTPLLDPQRNGELPIDELLEGALRWVAGCLNLQELDEPAGLKVRRLGRLMAEQTVVF